MWVWNKEKRWCCSSRNFSIPAVFKCQRGLWIRVLEGHCQRTIGWLRILVTLCYTIESSPFYLTHLNYPLFIPHRFTHTCICWFMISILSIRSDNLYLTSDITSTSNEYSSSISGSRCYDFNQRPSLINFFTDCM